MLELTTTRRRLPLAETTFVTTVPPYIQTYLGAALPTARRANRDFDPFGLSETEVDIVPKSRGTYLGMPMVMQQRLRRLHGGRMTRGINETTFVRKVPPYIQTYLGQHRYDERGDARELLGFGAIDTAVSVNEMRLKLRQVGKCTVDRSGPFTVNLKTAWKRFNGAMGAGARPVVSGMIGATTVRVDNADWMRLSTMAAGARDTCPGAITPSDPDPGSGGGGGGGGGRTTGPMEPIDTSNGGAAEASMFSNPMLLLGLAALGIVGYYAWSSYEEGEMMFLPSEGGGAPYPR